jgi:hypothetical protein
VNIADRGQTSRAPRYSRGLETATRLDDVQVVHALRERNEDAFTALTRELHHSPLRIGQIYVSSKPWPRKSRRRPGSATSRG